MNTAQLLAEQLQGSREWTLTLIADLQGDDWGYQPTPGAQHALWICGHLVSAQNTLVFKRCLGRDELSAEFGSHFPIGAPVLLFGEHPFPSPREVRAEMDRMQAKTIEAIAGLDDAKLTEPAFGAEGKAHPHYSTVCGAISHLSRHEAFHAGQLALLRRLLGKSFIR